MGETDVRRTEADPRPSMPCAGTEELDSFDCFPNMYIYVIFCLDYIFFLSNGFNGNFSEVFVFRKIFIIGLTESFYYFEGVSF